MVRRSSSTISIDTVELEDLLDDPEISDPELFEVLEASDELVAERVNAICKLLGHWRARDLEIRSEVARLSLRRRIFSTRVDRLRKYLRYTLGRLNESNVETGLYSVQIERPLDATSAQVVVR